MTPWIAPISPIILQIMLRQLESDQSERKPLMSAVALPVLKPMVRYSACQEDTVMSLYWYAHCPEHKVRCEAGDSHAKKPIEFTEEFGLFAREHARSRASRLMGIWNHWRASNRNRRYESVNRPIFLTC